jgi:hypothetical protein
MDLGGPVSELLRSFCDCGRHVRVLWSAPLGPTSRPVLLVCGYHPDRRCDFAQIIPESAVDVLDVDQDEQ